MVHGCVLGRSWLQPTEHHATPRPAKAEEVGHELRRCVLHDEAVGIGESWNMEKTCRQMCQGGVRFIRAVM